MLRAAAVALLLLSPAPGSAAVAEPLTPLGAPGARLCELHALGLHQTRPGWPRQIKACAP